MTQSVVLKFFNLSLSAILISLSFAAAAQAQAEGMVSVTSTRIALDTMNRLEALVKERGLNVFARIDHAAGAAKVGKTLRSTELLIFGIPQGGTPLMACAQTGALIYHSKHWFGLT